MSSTTIDEGMTSRQNHACLACGTEIIGPYCHSCGQKDDDCRRSILRLAAETLSNVASLDGKFVRTCSATLSRPGRHLHQYAHGRRSPFTPPVRFFFVVIFVFFFTLWVTDRNIFVLQLVPETAETPRSNVNFDLTVDEEGPSLSIGVGAGEGDEAVPEGDLRVAAGAEAAAALAELERSVRDALEDEGGPGPADPPVAPGEAPRSGVPPADESEAVRQARAEDVVPGPRIVPYGGFFLKAQDLTYTDEEREWLRNQVRIGEGATFLGRELASERVADALIMTMQNPAAFSNALNEVIPFLMLIFVPLMALLGALFIRGPDALVYDHLLLSLNTHAFAVVILILVLWFGFAIPDSVSASLFLAGMPLYYLFALRGAFRRGWLKSMTATLFVGAVYNVLFLVALAGAVAFSLWQIV